LQSLAARDKDFHALVGKQLDERMQTAHKLEEEREKLQSLETQVAIYFGPQVRELLGRVNFSPYIESRALEDFKSGISPQKSLSTPITVDFQNRLSDEVFADIAADPFRKQMVPVVQAMADELRSETSVGTR
jgi:hypothetical protein